MDGAAFVLVARDGVAAAGVDDRLGAAQPNAELRRASAHLARATLASYVAMGLDSPPLAAYRRDVEQRRCDGQHAVAAALGYRAAGIGWRTATTAHATTTVATLASVAARAVPLGQRAVARARWTLQDHIDAAVERAAGVACVDDLATGAPVLEVDGLLHRRLDGRLFAS
jgi:urease accessory protein UreF